MQHPDFKLQIDGTIYECDEFLLHYKNHPVAKWIGELSNSLPDIVVQTSGTTGVPKSIRLAKKSIFNSAKATLAFLEIEQGSRSLLCLDVRYIAGKMMVARAYIGGLTLIIGAVSSRPLKHVIEEIDFAAMVPMQVRESLVKLPLVKTLIIGGGIINAELWSALSKYPGKFLQTYGSTETVSHVAMRRIMGPFNQAAYKALPGVFFEVDKESCLIIHAPAIIDEPLVTNDLVDLINHESFHWIGRRDHVINSGGIKISPESIERELTPYIPEPFAVVGLPDAKFGQLVALVVSDANREVFEQTIGDALQKINPYFRPKKIIFNDFWPLTETNKLKRKALIEHLVNQGF